MAAASSDFFTEVGNPGSATTLAAPGHSIAGTTFNVTSTSNWPTTTGAVFAVDNYTLQTVNGVPNTAVRTPGTYTEWEGTVTSSTQISNAVLRYGTDQNYTAGTLTRVYIPVASSRENRFAQGMQVQHNQDGTHAAVSATSVSTTGAMTAGNGLTVSAGAVSVPNTATFVVPANLFAGTGTSWPWQSFSPTWTGLTAGNGTTVYKYIQIGKTVHFHIEFTLGTTSSVGATSTIVNLPVTAVTYPQFTAIGIVTLLTAAAGTIYWGKIAWNTSTQIRFVTDTVSGTTLRGADVTSTNPFTFVTGSILIAHGSYEAA
jgi:hypothetical protein